ncbi:hypothetical protein TRFO_18519 [Tritrichomonas foetus]|uniref:Uncharacterized protein n=1 Tax=Tritrichomonas foetus TaxID=1144522 RepID=A0A1J4KKU1_9EUKA|nr:hypothetical protein TRFO_18519 [Tritrichomonas foetus]|eukprot:OHT11843.1 hypothetical protein TRFO_18519 [Tritrichomonas foetus]
MSIQDKEEELQRIKQEIRETEDDIKEIQKQMLKKRSELSTQKQKTIRKSVKPQTVEPQFDSEIYKGLSEEHYQYIGKLKRQVTILQGRYQKIHEKNELIQEEINAQNEDITATENKIVDLKSQLFELSQENRNHKTNENFRLAQKREKKTEIADLHRATKDAELAITGVKMRSATSNEDRKDFKPYFDQLTKLTNEIRKVDKNIENLKEQIYLINIEMEKPIIPENEDEQEALNILDMPNLEELEPELQRMTEEVSQKEKELNDLRQKVKEKHSQSLLFEQKYEKIHQLLNENLKLADDLPSASADELLKVLNNVQSRSKVDEKTLKKQLNEKIEANQVIVGLIQKRIRKIEMEKIMNEREINKIKGEIKKQRDLTFDNEMSIVERIKELNRKIDNSAKKKKKQRPTQ